MTAMTDRTADRAAIADVFAQLEEAWSRADAAAYGALFTEDCTYTIWVGTQYRGRRAVVESHQALWSRFLKGTKLAGEIVSVDFPAPDVAILLSRGDVHKGAKRPRKLTKVQTTTLVRQADGAWRIAAFHNTKRKALMEAISFRTEPRLKPSHA